MGLFWRRRNDEAQSEPTPIDSSAGPEASPAPEEPLLDHEGHSFDDVPREEWPPVDDFTDGPIVDATGRWNWSLEFDEVYASCYEQQVGRVIESLTLVDGIDDVVWEDRESIVVLCSGGVESVRSTFLRLMTEALAADD